MSGGGVEVSGTAVLALAGVAAAGFLIWRANGAVNGLSSAIGDAVNGVTSAVRNAGAAVVDGANSVVSATGGNAYTNPSAYVVPSGYTTDWWAGGALKPATQATQADVRRIDNAIDAGTNGGYFFPWIDFSKA